MSTGHRLRLSSIASNATVDLLTHNPFAEDDVSVPTPIVLQRSNDQPTIHSDSQNRPFDLDATSSRHTHSRIRFSTSPSSGIHPLRSAGLAPGPNDAGITRPHLTRVLNVGTLVDVSSVESDHVPAMQPRETDVFVHNISPKDSLAGVSLKYGISMTELRRANHMWTSDSIHSRTELYIPVHKASRLKLPMTGDLISISPTEEQPDPMESFSETTDTPISQPLSVHSDSGAIRRVPASKLSFFPPSSIVKSSPLPQPPETFTHLTSTSTSSHNRYTSLPSNSLASLLTSLPIAASTRDTIIARLSFDSVSSSYSDRQEEVDSHELDDVHTSPYKTHDAYTDVQVPAPLDTPVATHHTPRNILDSASQNFISTEPSHMHVRRMSGSPQSYIPPHTQIRTMQMEPSPVMQLPMKRRTVQTNILEPDVDLENTF